MPRSKLSADSLLTTAWRSRGLLAWLLLPVSLVFGLLSLLRRALYRIGALHAEKLRVPVIVIGNISVGGSGKTPLVLYVAQGLAQQGLHPGLVSRGYRAQVRDVAEVFADSDSAQVGDEPVLLKRRFGGPVFVGNRRADVARALLAAHPSCNVIVLDDGLQHYGLSREIEVAVMDRRGLMNGWLLPAGPLREPAGRLRQVDALVLNGLPAASIAAARTFTMFIEGSSFYRLGDPARTCEAAALAGLRLHAVAGIGEPQRFFDHLQSLALSPSTHSFPDHHRYVAGDLDFAGDAILTTEKDAVKFGNLARLPVWVLPVEARVEPDLVRFLLEKLNGRPPA